MDDARQKLDSSADHIFLRYATQFTLNGRQRTVEMSIPVPLGASAEQREQLLREADAGMLQLSQHVEQLVTGMLQGKPLSTPQGAIQASAPTTTGTLPSTRPAPTNRPATTPATQTLSSSNNAAHPASVADEQAPAAQRVPAPPSAVRQSGGISMARTSSNITGDNIISSIPTFIEMIRDELGLTPRQAMDMLRIKTLKDINLREALETLRGMTARDRVPAGESDRRSNGQNLSVPQPQPVTATHPTSNSGPIQLAAPAPAAETSNTTGRTPVAPPEPRREEPPITYRFDEELDADDLPEDEPISFEDDDLDEDLLDSSTLSPQERIQARIKINELREIRGATTANPTRLQALYNVVDGSISRDKLDILTAGIWGTTILKKLKVDQLEALISWGKQDDFANEAEAVLKVLEEEQ